MSKRKRKKLRGTVQKVLKPILPWEPEKAEISVEGADELYREIRVENVLTDENGEKVRLKTGAEVDVILEAEAQSCENPDYVNHASTNRRLVPNKPRQG